MYRQPDGPRLELKVSPALDSWNSHDHADQIRLRRFLDHVDELLGPSREEHLALALQVGLPDSGSRISVGGDLDNYLFPIARRLGAARFDAVFGAKVRGDISTLAVGQATLIGDDRKPDMRVRTTVSVETRAWKEQVRAACAASAPGEPLTGSLSVDIEFRLNPARNWASTWKPAIDSLGPVLGAADALRPFAPNDDRIVRLGLHRTLDPSLGWDIEISVWWATVDS